jgi:aminopeptidase N
MELDDARVRALCVKQFGTADNMTDAIAALSLLANCDCPERARALDAFYDKWKNEPLVVDKWLAVQSTTRLPSALANVKRLMAHAAFNIKNPNKVYALIGGFRANSVRFHAADGSGYAFLADQIIALDAINPQVASRMARGFDRWRKFDARRQAHAKASLERIAGSKGISKGVAEIVAHALA